MYPQPPPNEHVSNQPDVGTRCVRGNQCVKSVPDPARTGRFIGVLLCEPGICSACTTHVRDAIGHLPADYSELNSLIAAGSGQSEDFITGSRELKVPIRLGVEALRQQIDFELTFWAVRTARSYWPLDRSNSLPDHRVKRAAGYLRRNLEDLLRLREVPHVIWDIEGRPVPDTVDIQSGTDAALCLLELHYRVKRVAGRTELVHRLSLPCPRCHRATLVRQNGSDVTTCEHCDRRIPENEYSWFAHARIQQGKQSA